MTRPRSRSPPKGGLEPRDRRVLLGDRRRPAHRLARRQGYLPCSTRSSARHAKVLRTEVGRSGRPRRSAYCSSQNASGAGACTRGAEPDVRRGRPQDRLGRGLRVQRQPGSRLRARRKPRWSRGRVRAPARPRQRRGEAARPSSAAARRSPTPVPACCGWPAPLVCRARTAGADLTFIVPPAQEAAGPALKFFANVGAGNVSTNTDRLARLRIADDVPNGVYTAQQICLPPKLVGRRLTAQFSTRRPRRWLQHLHRGERVHRRRRARRSARPARRSSRRPTPAR